MYAPGVKRTVLTLLFSLGCAGTGGSEAPPSPTVAQTPAASGTPAPAAPGSPASAAPDSAPASTDTFCDALVGVLCEANQRCCAAGGHRFPDVAACRSERLGLCRGMYSRISPALRFEAGPADAALAEMRAAAATCQPLDMNGIMGRPLIGTIAEGEACEPHAFVNMHACAPGLACSPFPQDGPPSYPGRCVRARGEGDPCHRAVCAPGLFCEDPAESRSTCRPLLADGARCRSADHCRSSCIGSRPPRPPEKGPAGEARCGPRDATATYCGR